MIISKMKKMFRLLFTSEISSFISPSIDISEKQSDYEALIEAPNLDYVNRYEKELSQFLKKAVVHTVVVL